MNQYARALELDPKALEQNARVGITAQVSSPEERAKFYYLLAKIQAERGDVLECLACLKKAKDNGYRNLAKLTRRRNSAGCGLDPRLAGESGCHRRRNSDISSSGVAMCTKQRMQEGSS